jgi:hypothetical protein
MVAAAQSAGQKYVPKVVHGGNRCGTSTGFSTAIQGLSLQPRSRRKMILASVFQQTRITAD